eukprot:snap_masked-scaffold208_size258758-processed-gene-1.0 protein:Tk04201 transcript:snap_masked-scaffold208_size258758-processed-gene-1.0-mRNA-1 annotation:"3-hydroxy-3-methylglutaryl- reductase"
MEVQAPLKPSKVAIAATNSTSSSDRHTPEEQQSRSLPTLFIRKIFKSHGEFCASQPWEVIVTTFIFLICVLTVGSKHVMMVTEMDSSASSKIKPCLPSDPSCVPEHHSRDWIETLVMAGFYCLAVLHITYRFKKIHLIRSNLIFNIALCYMTFASLLYALIIWSIGNPLKDNLHQAWFLIFLLVDMQKVTRMGQFALSSSHHRRISENVANGMYVLAPTFALDCLAKIFLVGLGSLTRIPQLEAFSWYAVVSVMVNFLVYLTFYPAGLSLVLELMYCTDGRPRWDVRQIINTLPGEDGQTPVVHRVKVVATALLMIAHIIFRPPFLFSSASGISQPTTTLFSWATTNIEKVLITVVIVALSIKYLFYEDMDEAQELRKTYIEELTRKFAEDSEQEEFNRGNKVEMDRVSNSTDEGISIGSSAKPRPPSCASRHGDDSSSESAWSEVGYLPDLKDQEAQTTDMASSEDEVDDDENGEKRRIRHHHQLPKEPRSLEECTKIYKGTMDGVEYLIDEEVVHLVEKKVIRAHALESVLNNPTRGVEIRRKYVEKVAKRDIGNLPFRNFDYDTVMGACCESVIGYMTMPVGVAGPLNLDGQLFYVPMATTEGCLVASVNRGCSALRTCGVTSRILADGMTRGPIVRFPNIAKMAEAKEWMEEPENFLQIKSNFDSTSRFARLQRLKLKPAGRELYIRFVAYTGDAMGMNMISKAAEFSLKQLIDVFPEMELVSLSGNMCTDKKPAAINWLDGRGKSVICEATVPGHIVETVLKTSPAALADLNRSKNLVGSAMAGSIGGFNAQAANVVTAVFIATGQDAAQNVASSNCLTQIDVVGDDLYMTCTMPSIEVGTVGGGTILTAQGACLDLLGVKGCQPASPGANAKQLASVVCATVLAGELSLMSALAAGHLVKSHLRHNRSNLAVGSVAGPESMAKPMLCIHPNASVP